MKYITLSLAAGFAIIGIHQVMMNSSSSITEGISVSYWLFMMSIMMLFWYQFLNKKDIEKENNANKNKNTESKPKVKTGGKGRKKPKKLG